MVVGAGPVITRRPCNPTAAECLTEFPQMQSRAIEKARNCSPCNPAQNGLVIAGSPCAVLLEVFAEERVYALPRVLRVRLLIAHPGEPGEHRAGARSLTQEAVAGARVHIWHAATLSRSLLRVGGFKGLVLPGAWRCHTLRHRGTHAPSSTV